jgi:hypothetical protein
MREADPNWARLLDHLAEAGPSNIEDLHVELELKPKDIGSANVTGAGISSEPGTRRVTRPVALAHHQRTNPLSDDARPATPRGQLAATPKTG